MSILKVILPFLKKFKYAAICMVVGLLTYLVCMRFRSRLNIRGMEIWLWVGGAIAISLVIIGIVVFIKRRHEKKMAAALEAGLATSEDDKIDLRGEIKALRENWHRSLERLKQARPGASSGSMLYNLPWYVIIGEPASGKSTLLRQSGLDFPVGDAAVSGMHGTKNCDWWFANEAIFLDTAGRYIIETQQSEWAAFLTLLKKYRKKKPINGVLVAIAADTLLTRTHDERIQDGKRVRARVDELIELLGVNFPVYILVTKCDLVAGFTEFFGSLEGRNSAQMVGWTYPQKPEARFDLDEYDAKFEKTSAQLYHMRPWLESQASKRDLMKAFLFPEEFAYLGSPLRDVLDVVFKANVYQETPVCRGVYFSSGTQVGSPLARALEDMAKELNIQADFGFGLAMEEEKEVRAYFIRDLVGEQILKDKEMIWRTWQSDVKVKKRRTGWGISAVAALALFGILSVSSFLRNRSTLSDFQEYMPKEGRALEVSVGCLDALEKAEDPTILDAGLNYTDEVKPTIERSFRELFTKGCLDPMIDGVEKPVEAGIQSGEGGPDIPAYVKNYGHYLYLKQALAKELPDVYTPEKEEDHLRFLYEILERRDATGRKNKEDLREVLIAYADVAGFDDFPESRRNSIEGTYKKNVGAFIGGVEAWVDREKSDEKAVGNRVENSINNLKDACFRSAVRINGHENPELIVEIAKGIHEASRPEGGGGNSLPIGSLASGVDSPAELLALLSALKPTVDKEGPLAGKLTKLASSLDRPLDDKEMQAKREARDAIRKWLGTVIQSETRPMAWDDRPTTLTLEARRAEIKDILKTVEDEAWRALKPHVDVLETEPLEEEDEATGVMKRRKGWWETLILLAEARRTDLLHGEYLSKGLTTWLSNDRWMRERGDRDDQVFATRHFEDTVLGRLDREAKFFENPKSARVIGRKAEEEMLTALAAYFKEMEEYWLGEFNDAIPSPALTLGEAYEQLNEWTDPQARFRRTAEDIRKALTEIMTVEGGALLAQTEPERQKIFEAFVLCFDPKDRTISRYPTIEGADSAFGGLRRTLADVSGGSGSQGDRERSRRLMAKMINNDVRTFRAAEEQVRKFKGNADRSPPAAAAAAWMEAVIRNAESEIVRQTYEDINLEWRRLRGMWKSQLSRGSPLAFRKVFGSSGEYEKFRRDYLEPFFDIPTFKPKRGEGTHIVLVDSFHDFLDNIELLTRTLFGPDGSPRNDNVHMILQLGGDSNPESLVVEYTGATTPKLSEEFRNFGKVEFDIDWSPTTCRMFRLIVKIDDTETKEFKYTGPWAVAEALNSATRSGSKYVWAGMSDKGRYEARLEISGDTTLIDLFMRFGKAPGENLDIPDVAVELKKE